MSQSLNIGWLSTSHYLHPQLSTQGLINRIIIYINMSKPESRSRNASFSTAVQHVYLIPHFKTILPLLLWYNTSNKKEKIITVSQRLTSANIGHFCGYSECLAYNVHKILEFWFPQSFTDSFPLTMFRVLTSPPWCRSWAPAPGCECPLTPASPHSTHSRLRVQRSHLTSHRPPPCPSALSTLQETAAISSAIWWRFFNSALM